MAVDPLSSTTSRANQIVDSVTGLSDISRQIQTISDNLIKQRSRQVQEFQKETRDVKIDTMMTARDVGVLKQDQHRLNIFSALTKGDTADVYRFRVDKKAATRFNYLVGNQDFRDKIRFQLFSKTSGKLIADSNPKAGDAYQNYLKLTAGSLELAKGDYAMRVSRIEGFDRPLKENINYAMQFTQGTFGKDFDTIEKAARSGDNPYGLGNLGVVTTNLLEGMSNSYSFINNLPPIGTPASKKLSGLLLNGTF